DGHSLKTREGEHVPLASFGGLSVGRRDSPVTRLDDVDDGIRSRRARRGPKQSQLQSSSTMSALPGPDPSSSTRKTASGRAVSGDANRRNPAENPAVIHCARAEADLEEDSHLPIR